jgi:hypothetical protein
MVDGRGLHRAAVDRFLAILVSVWAIGAVLPIGAWTAITSIERYTDTWNVWWPGAVVCGALTVTLLLLSRGGVARALRAGLARAVAVPAPAFVAVAGGIACIEAVSMAAVYFARNPQIEDSWAQCFQARLFLAGKLVTGPPLSFPHFAAEHLLMTPQGWASQYPPVHPMLLAAGLAVGFVWLVTPLLAALLPLGVYLLGRVTGDERVARLAAVLTLASPFVIATNASAMNHLPAALCAAFGLAAVASTARGSVRAAIVLGGAVGLLVGLRPLDGVALGLVSGAGVLAALGRRRWTVLLAFTTGAIITVAPTLVFNTATTGSPFVFTALRVWGPGHAIGVGQEVPWGQAVTFASAVGHLGLDAHNIDIYLLEWPLPVSLLIAVGLWLRGGRLDDGLRPAVGFLLVLVTGLAFYFHRDIIHGPRLHFSILPAVFVLLAAAMVRLADIRVPTGWRRLRVGDVVLTLLVVMFVVAGVVRGSRRLASHDMRHTVFALHPDEDARRAGITNAVVLIPDGWRMRLIARMWAAGIPMRDSPRIYTAFDACTLEERLAAASVRGVRGAPLVAELKAAMATATPGRKVPQVTGDPLLRLPEESRLLTPRCLQELARDRQGVLRFEPYLYLNAAGFDGDIVWAREMGPEDVRLAELYPGRAFYRYMVAADGTPQLIPLRPSSAVSGGEGGGVPSYALPPG